MDDRRTRIADSFGAAAERYDDHAAVQRVVAGTVGDLVGLLRLPERPRVLEIGCGTGFLTRDLQARLVGAEMIVTDLSPAMLARATKGGMIGATFLPMDGEQPWFEGAHFDLIASSLAFQWFDDFPGAIARLTAMLRPRGSLIFSTMGQGSFAGWRAAHDACGVAAGVPDYPSLEQLRAILADYADAFAFDEDYVLTGGAKALVAHLKGIGAAVPVEGRTPLPPRTLKAVMRAFDAAGGEDRYQVLFGRVTRS